MFTYREDFRMVKTVGCFIVALTDTGKFVFFDQNLFAIKVLPLFEAEQKEGKMEVIDFEFLNVDSFCQYADDVKVLLKVKTEEGVQVNFSFGFLAFNTSFLFSSKFDS
jgi:hypothetical protein